MKTLVIAEAGVNHNGDFSLAMKLVDAAADAGADFIKFQSFKADKLVSKVAKQASYQSINTGHSFATQYEMLKNLEMPEQWHHDLIKYARQKGLQFLSTPFDEDTMDFLAGLDMAYLKIPSGEITNKPYLQHAARKKMAIILSTGMATLQEISSSITVMEEAGMDRSRLTVLHCNTEYPTPMADVNLLAMKTIEKVFGVKVGYSDHTPGIEVALAAVTLGAVIIEKHLTTDRGLPGPDHLASLVPEELKAMVKAIRNIELALGSTTKSPSPSETKNMDIARKSIHLTGPVVAGTVLKRGHMIMKRPGDGISPMRIDEMVGRTVKVGLPAEHKLSEDDLL